MISLLYAGTLTFSGFSVVKRWSSVIVTHCCAPHAGVTNVGRPILIGRSSLLVTTKNMSLGRRSFNEVTFVLISTLATLSSDSGSRTLTETGAKVTRAIDDAASSACHW